MPAKKPTKEKPATQVMPTMQPELEAWIARFIADDGPWKKFIKEEQKIIAIVEKAMFSQEQHDYYNQLMTFNKTSYNKRGTIPSAPTNRYNKFKTLNELSHQETENLILGGFGLTGEIGNGASTVVHHYLVNDAGRFTAKQKVNKLLGAFRHESELGHNEEVALRYGANFNKGGHLHHETRLEAFARCAGQVETWVQLNPELFSVDERKNLEEHLNNYRAAIKEIKCALTEATAIKRNTIVTHISMVNK